MTFTMWLWIVLGPVALGTGRALGNLNIVFPRWVAMIGGGLVAIAAGSLLQYQLHHFTGGLETLLRVYSWLIIAVGVLCLLYQVVIWGLMANPNYDGRHTED